MKTSLQDALTQLPARRVLEWIDVPALAMADDGSIVFANRAFADMIGFTTDMVRCLSFRQIFAILPEDDPPLDVLADKAEMVVELLHLDGSIVQATMSEPLVLEDGELALITFDDMTERLRLSDLG